MKHDDKRAVGSERIIADLADSLQHKRRVALRELQALDQAIEACKHSVLASRLTRRGLELLGSIADMDQQLEHVKGVMAVFYLFSPV